MSEAVLQYFMYNDNIYPVEEFDEKYTEKYPSIYEVIRVIKGTPLFIEEHFARLVNSARLLGYDLNTNMDYVRKCVVKVIEINKIENYNIKIVLNNINTSKYNTYFFFIKSTYPDEELYNSGVHTILFKAVRDNPNAKVINQNLRTTVNNLLIETGNYEALLVNDEDCITEGSRSNVFFIKNNKVFTAPEKDVLSGITRQRIITLCRSNGIDVVEAPIHSDAIDNFQAAFISGTSPKVLPISKIDKIQLSSINETLIKIMNIYDLEIEKYLAVHN